MDNFVKTQMHDIYDVVKANIELQGDEFDPRLIQDSLLGLMSVICKIYVECHELHDESINLLIGFVSRNIRDTLIKYRNLEDK